MGHSNNEKLTMDNININNPDFNITNPNEITISAADSIDTELVSTLYSEEILHSVLTASLDYIDKCIKNGVNLPYFADIDEQLWEQKTKALDIYITDAIEGCELNLESRGKDYATNILSYPSEMPTSIIELMPTLPLGELIICHEVVVREAAEQEKTIEQHISHLLVHGILHLLGFDHELGQQEQDEMESYEIDILAHLNLPNPYL